MESVYVLEPGCYLRKEGGSLKIVKNNEVIDRVPANGLKQLMLFGYVSLTGSVLDFLIRNRVETVFMTPTGRFRARLLLDEHLHVRRRQAQYNRLSDERFKLDTARMIVQGKIKNLYRFLILRGRQYRSENIKKAAARLHSIYGGLAEAPNLDALKGMEGLATRFYYHVFHHLIQNEQFEFDGRNRRPPKDPVNALLSFVYTLLTNEVLSAIRSCGLDPYLGSLHEISYGRPSLACDLVEEYRSFLGDRFVLGLINRRIVEKKDFVFRKGSPETYIDEDEMKAKRPIEMKPIISRTLISAYETMMNRRIHYGPLDKKITYRWLIHQQVRRFGEYLENPEAGYRPFQWEV